MILEEQNGTLVYSDGNETETRMLEIAKQYPDDLVQDFIADNCEYTINNTFSSVRENILNWYPFKDNCTILEIGSGMGSITGLLCNKARAVTSVEMNFLRAEIIKTRYANRKNLTVLAKNIEDIDKSLKFDYVIMIGVLEYAEVFFDNKEPFKYMLELAKSHLNENGIILCAIENRFGLKYWCGASEDHLQEPFAGINGYVKDKTPKTFSKYALSQLFDSAGFIDKRFYYVLPDYRFPRFIYTDEHLPISHDIDNIPFTYSKGSLLHLKEQSLYYEIIKNNNFDFFANSFLIEAGNTNKLEDYKIIFASARGEAKKEYRCITTIDNRNKVIKYPAHIKSKEHIKNIYDYYLYLKSRGIMQIEQSYDNKKLSLEFVSYKRADIAFGEALISNDLKQLYNLIDKLKESLIKSSDIEIEKNILVDLGYINNGKYNGVVLKYGFIDMTFYNAFIVDEELVFFDQEWRIENIPLNFILYYAIKIAYERTKIIHKVSINVLLDYAGITEFSNEFDKLESYIWSEVMYRTGDLYGKDGYCNQYSENLTLGFKFDQINQKINNLNQEVDKVFQEKEQLNLEVNKVCQEKEQLNLEVNKVCQEKEQLNLEIDKVYQEREQLKQEIDKVYQEKEQLKQKIDKVYQEKEQLNLEIDKVYQMKEQLNQGIDKLKESEEKLNSRLNSVLSSSETWKLALKFSLFNIKAFPSNSKRRLFAKILYILLSHPFRFISNITPKKMVTFFLVLKNEGPSGVSKRINYHIYDKYKPLYKQEIKVLAINTQENINDYKSIVFKKENNPVVSIIIPVYNQFDYTYNCLKSVLDYSGNNISYEIIIANDCSNDLTCKINKIISNISVITTPKNLGFLRNCNNAAKYSKGKYILFLNNDTQVQENWLSPMVELMGKDESIGAVGSKLIYEDGRLQEAGGIFWNDASAWNYGRRSDPSLPEFNYVKEVDYISGASLMIKRTLWNKVGGFNEIFSPAYYEDSDLCFSLRKLGYKIVYQPLSVVVHYEGISNGTDITQGQKQYQVANKKTFFDKWKNILEKEHFPNGKNIFFARDRSRNKRTILFIDHYVPHFDKDAGSRAVFHYINLFINIGYNVKFIGDNFYKHEPYTTILNQLGVEVLYGNYYFNNWKLWIRENSDYINMVFLNRPHISCKYIDFLKQFPNIKTAYLGHDLHFLRAKREYEITKDNKLLKSSKKMENLEFYLMKKVDVSYYFSQIEIDIIKSKFKNLNAKVIPINIFKNFFKKNIPFKDRKNLLFVGGFSHTPNIDALQWMCNEIMPFVIKKYPDIKLNVVGSNAPKEVYELESENIIIKGYLSDNELEKIYDFSRISVVPLRYGAGVKGKVIEAIYNQIPVITTSIGSEGILNAEMLLSIKDNSFDFANEIMDLYFDFKLLKQKSDISYLYIKENFTEDAALRVLRNDFII